MSQNFHWTCPYCKRDTTITANNFASHGEAFNNGNKDGPLYVEFNAIICPNNDCKEYAINAKLFKYDRQYTRKTGIELQTWQLRPSSNAKVFPDFVPKPILDDYNEACLIVDLRKLCISPASLS